MAVCPHCNGEMREGISCRPDPIIIGDAAYEPIRWGDERNSQRWVIDFPCRDCATPPGGVHHRDCCVERCPACLGQALGCECFADPDDEAWDDDGPATFGPPPPGRAMSLPLLVRYLDQRSRSFVAADQLDSDVVDA